MRFTLTLEDDLYRVAKSMSKAEDTSISKSINRLIRKGLEKSDQISPEKGNGSKLSSFPVSHGCVPFSEEDVKDLEVAEDISRWNDSYTATAS